MADEGVRSAVYYPHTGIRTVELLKCGLLLWDQIEFIAPSPRFRPLRPRAASPEEQKLVDEATELLLVRHLPTREERKYAHDTVELLVKSDLAEHLRQTPGANTRYLIYDRKFLPETWRLLEDSNLARVDLKDPDRDYMMSPTLGLVMMSVLADACAGTLKRTVTDQHGAYATVRESILKNAVSSNASARALPELLDVTFRVADVRAIPLSDLVAIRKREAKEGASSSLTALRRNLATQLDVTAQEIARATTSPDCKTITENFESDMKRDLARLKNDLGGLAWNIVFSREFAAGVLIGAGLFSVPGGQAAAGAVALGGAALAYRKQRLETLEKHPMSWLYLQT